MVIHSNDHPPPHVHVVGPDVAAKIAIGQGARRATVIVNTGLSRAQLTAALFEIGRNEELLLQVWREVHGEG